jgi:hypothetical protein
MSEEQKSTVPAFIPTTWHEGGEPDVFTPIEECTTGQINTYILKILEQVWALQNEIALLTSYKTLAAALAAALSDDTP